MEFIVTLAKWIAGPLIGVLVTVLLTEPLRERLLPILAAIGTKDRQGITGVWRATFLFGTPRQSYVEHIELRHRFGVIVGRIIPSPENYAAAKAVENRRPLRVRGVLKDNLFFSGVWFHPAVRSHHTGTFDLLVNRDNDTMTGHWLGYSEGRHAIESEQWLWQRADQDGYL
jgi:hypothetical protein